MNVPPSHQMHSDGERLRHAPAYWRSRPSPAALPVPTGLHSQQAASAPCSLPRLLPDRLDPACLATVVLLPTTAALILIGILHRLVRVQRRRIRIDTVRLRHTAAVTPTVDPHRRIGVTGRAAAALPVPAGLHGQRARKRALLALRLLPDRLDPGRAAATTTTAAARLS